MKIIFLDIDGVLNCKDTFIKRYKNKQITGYYDLEIDCDMVERLSRIVLETNSLIVLSSSWRIFFKSENNVIIAHDKGLELVDLLNKYNLSIYDITPYDINRNRSREIASWLQKHNVLNFIILDDESYDLVDFLDNLVLCNYNHGLTDELCEIAINKLNVKAKVKK